VGRLEIRTAYLNVYRRRQSQVQYRVNQPARLEIGRHLRQLALDPLANPIHVLIASDSMALVQAGLNESRVRIRVGRVHGREARSRSYVGYDQPQVFGAYFLANDFLDPGHGTLRDRHIASSRRLEVDDELAGIGAGKIGQPQSRQQTEAEQE